MTFCRDIHGGGLTDTAFDQNVLTDLTELIFNSCKYSFQSEVKKTKTKDETCVIPTVVWQQQVYIE